MDRDRVKKEEKEREREEGRTEEGMKVREGEGRYEVNYVVPKEKESSSSPQQSSKLGELHSQVRKLEWNGMMETVSEVKTISGSI